MSSRLNQKSVTESSKRTKGSRWQGAILLFKQKLAVIAVHTTLRIKHLF